MSESRTQHELLKREMKSKILELSIKHSIVTQFTSFVAIEKRDQNEASVITTGPSLEELLSQEDVDFLDYMAYDAGPDEGRMERGAEEADNLPVFNYTSSKSRSASSYDGISSEEEELECTA